MNKYGTLLIILYLGILVSYCFLIHCQETGSQNNNNHYFADRFGSWLGSARQSASRSLLQLHQMLAAPGFLLHWSRGGLGELGLFKCVPPSFSSPISSFSFFLRWFLHLVASKKTEFLHGSRGPGRCPNRNQQETYVLCYYLECTSVYSRQMVYSRQVEES